MRSCAPGACKAETAVSRLCGPRGRAPHDTLLRHKQHSAGRLPLVAECSDGQEHLHSTGCGVQ
jgi:hypothetical protein